MRVLTINPGSTSCKFAVVDSGSAVDEVAAISRSQTLESTSIAEWVDQSTALADECDVVVVRVVHGGGRLVDHGFVDENTIDILRAVVSFAPNHNPASLAIIEAVRSVASSRPVVAALDSAFHKSMPAVATTYAIPRSWRALGLRRLGFHGLSHAWVARRAPLVADGAPARRVVSCHLGGGSSVTALLDGASIDTTMGFTPMDGIPMTTRSGSLDPGIITHAMRALHLGPDEVDRALSGHAGLAGISGRSGDMRELLIAEASGDGDAALAVAVFVHRVRAAIATMAASLEGIDMLVFTGGIGSGSAVLRSRVVDGLHWMGARLVTAEAGVVGVVGPVGVVGDLVISKPTSTPLVAVVECREDLEMFHIARAVVAND